MTSNKYYIYYPGPDGVTRIAMTARGGICNPHGWREAARRLHWHAKRLQTRRKGGRS